MPSLCKGRCEKDHMFDKSGRYENGTRKRCQVCSIYVKTMELMNCPCCNAKLRTRPRNNRTRRARVAAYRRID